MVLSATLDIEQMSDFFDGAPTMQVPGRVYPIEMFHDVDATLASIRGKFIERAVEAVKGIHESEDIGHILVFLTGKQDIESACQRPTEALPELASNPSIRKIEIYPLYSSLELLEQQAILIRCPMT